MVIWQAAEGGHGAGVGLPPEHCPSLRVCQQPAQSTAASEVDIFLHIICDIYVIVIFGNAMLDLLPPLWVVITVTASFQYFCGTSVFKNLRGLSLPAISWYLEQFCVHCIYF